MWADVGFGGAGIRDFRYEQIVIEENMRRGDVGFYMTLHSRIVAPYIGELGNAELKQRVLPGCVRGETILGIAITESGAGSDLAGVAREGLDPTAVQEERGGGAGRPKRGEDRGHAAVVVSGVEGQGHELLSSW